MNPQPELPSLDRYLGCMLGLAAGDAVGTTVEFRSRGSFQPLTDMVGGGPFNLQAGQWTDDTSMALCLAASLVEKQGFDPSDQIDRYCRWWRKGYMSATGTCFDIGTTVRGALSRYSSQAEGSRNPYAGSTDANTAGNGSLMRLAPVPLFYASQPDAALARAADSSRTTHRTEMAVDACRYFAGLIVGAIQGVDKETLLSPGYSPVANAWDREPLHERVREVAQGSFKAKGEMDIKASGFVIHTLEAALWAFHTTANFKDGCLKAVNLGEDADTTGAVFGQLAGAYYGREGIPAEWIARLAQRELIERLAVELHQHSFPG